MAVNHKENFSQWLAELSIERDAIVQERDSLENEISTLQQRNKFLSVITQSLSKAEKSTAEDLFMKKNREEIDSLKLRLGEAEGRTEERLFILNFIIENIEAEINK